MAIGERSGSRSCLLSNAAAAELTGCLSNSLALESVRMSDGKLNMIMVKIGGSFSSLPRLHGHIFDVFG